MAARGAGDERRREQQQQQAAAAEDGLHGRRVRSLPRDPPPLKSAEFGDAMSGSDMGWARWGTWRPSGSARSWGRG
eukprot:1911354-Rhodomonas_salina.4